MEKPQIQAILVDDEKLGRDTLQLLLQKCCPEVKVVASLSGLATLASYLENGGIDALFLDINIPGENVFEFLETYQPDIPVIFTTAHSNYALQAFKVNALGYLLKPIDATELKNVVARIYPLLKAPKLFVDAPKPAAVLKKIMIADTDGFVLLDVDDIVRCVASDNYTEVILINGKKHVVSKTLKDFEETLSPHSFFRVHNSYLINLIHVIQYSKSGQVKMRDNSWVEVSKRKKIAFMDLFRSMGV
jgi:two-component system, LytTR family, response regulator